jgi:hypothetical protein
MQLPFIGSEPKPDPARAVSFDELWAELEASRLTKRYRFYIRPRNWVRRQLGRPKDACYQIKWFIQRGRRGYSDYDLWSFDHYIAGVLAKAARELALISHGHPRASCSCPPNVASSHPLMRHVDQCDGMERWKEVLAEMAAGFEEYAGNIPGTVPYGRNPTLNRSMNLFKQHFEALWD